MTEDRPYLTTQEVADKLDVSLRRAQQYAHDDCLDCDGEGCEHCEYTGQRLPGAFKVGGTWMVPRSAVYYFRRRDAYRKGWEEWQERMQGDEDD